MSVGKFVVTKGKHWSGLTLKNHIGAIFGSRPQLASKITTVLLQQSGMKNLDTSLSMFPEKVLESSEDFVWKLVGSDERNIPLTEARYQGAVVADGDTGSGARPVEKGEQQGAHSGGKCPSVLLQHRL